MASGLPGNRSSGKLQNQAILLEFYVWSSRPGRSFMVSGVSDIHMQAGSARNCRGRAERSSRDASSRGIEATRGSGPVVLIVGRRTLKFPDRFLKDRAHLRVESTLKEKSS